MQDSVGDKDGAELKISIIMSMASLFTMMIMQVNNLFVVLLRGKRSEYFYDTSTRQRN